MIVLLIIRPVGTRERPVEGEVVRRAELRADPIREPSAAQVFLELLILCACFRSGGFCVAQEVMVDRSRQIDRAAVISEVRAGLEANAGNQRIEIVLRNLHAVAATVVVAEYTAVGELSLRRDIEDLRKIKAVTNLRGQANRRVVIS